METGHPLVELDGAVHPRGTGRHGQGGAARPGGNDDLVDAERSQLDEEPRGERVDPCLTLHHRPCPDMTSESTGPPGSQPRVTASVSFGDGPGRGAIHRR